MCGFEYEIIDGEVTITGINGFIGSQPLARYDGDRLVTYCDDNFIKSLTIPDSIDGYPVTKIDEWAFAPCKSLVHISIPNSIINISSTILYTANSLSKINDIEIVDRFCKIQNRFIYTNKYILKIVFNILDCYIVKIDCLEGSSVYDKLFIFINGKLCDLNLTQIKFQENLYE